MAPLTTTCHFSPSSSFISSLFISIELEYMRVWFNSFCAYHDSEWIFQPSPTMFSMPSAQYTVHSFFPLWWMDSLSSQRTYQSTNSNKMIIIDTCNHAILTYECMQFNKVSLSECASLMNVQLFSLSIIWS